MLKIQTTNGIYQSRIYRRPSEFWFSGSKGDVLINEMNVSHLANAIKKLEKSAVKERQYVSRRHPDLARRLNRMSVAALTEYLCPLYRNLVDELTRRQQAKPVAQPQVKVSAEDSRSIDSLISKAVNAALQKAGVVPKTAEPTFQTTTATSCAPKTKASWWQPESQRTRQLNELFANVTEEQRRLWTEALAAREIRSLEDLGNTEISTLLMLNLSAHNLSALLFAIKHARIALSGYQNSEFLDLTYYDAASRSAAGQHTNVRIAETVRKIRALYTNTTVWTTRQKQQVQKLVATVVSRIQELRKQIFDDVALQAAYNRLLLTSRFGRQINRRDVQTSRGIHHTALVNKVREISPESVKGDYARAFNRIDGFLASTGHISLLLSALAASAVSELDLAPA